jgi:hypothetical protein
MSIRRVSRTGCERIKQAFSHVLDTRSRNAHATGFAPEGQTPIVMAAVGLQTRSHEARQFHLLRGSFATMQQ